MEWGSTIRLPKKLEKEIEPLLKKFHYTSLSEFVRDAIRERITHHKRGETA